MSGAAAAALYEKFQGKEAEWVTVDREPHMPQGDYAQLGELLALYVKPMAGGQVQQIKWVEDLPVVVADTSGRQIYFFKGSQDISDSLEGFGARELGNGVFQLGEGRRIDYKARKEHVADPDADEWRHDFGEESGVRPKVLFDTRMKRLLLEGGNYRIEAPGIID